MTDKKISELTEVTSPAGSDVLPIVSGGDTKKVTVDNLLAGATGGGGTTVLGPFSVAWDDADIDAGMGGTGEEIGPLLPAGTLIVTMWAVITQEWAAASGIVDFVNVRNDTHDVLFSFGIVSVSGDLVNMLTGASVFTRVDMQLQVIASAQDPVAMAAGAADIYALVQYP
jgi:hypothetical protein